MHSYWSRLNTAVTFFGSVAAVVCLLTTSTDLFHHASPAVNIKLNQVKKLAVYKGVNDQAYLSIKVDADLRSVFSWNTKQVFAFIQAEYETEKNKLNQVVLWDTIIEKQEDAHIIAKSLKQEYQFVDQGKNLRGKPLNITMVWNVMPRVGRLYTRSQSFSVGPLPDQYIW